MRAAWARSLSRRCVDRQRLVEVAEAVRALAASASALGRDDAGRSVAAASRSSAASSRVSTAGLRREAPRRHHGAVAHTRRRRAAAEGLAARRRGRGRARRRAAARRDGAAGPGLDVDGRRTGRHEWPRRDRRRRPQVAAYRADEDLLARPCRVEVSGGGHKVVDDPGSEVRLQAAARRPRRPASVTEAVDEPARLERARPRRLGRQHRVRRRCREPGRAGPRRAPASAARGLTGRVKCALRCRPPWHARRTARTRPRRRDASASATARVARSRRPVRRLELTLQLGDAARRRHRLAASASSPRC